MGSESNLSSGRSRVGAEGFAPPEQEPVEADAKSIGRAAEVLRNGGLVAMPTETVYGLAADASSPDAVRQVFEVKRRPSRHPLIVHIGNVDDLSHWVRVVPEDAIRLTDAFWPGPLTIVLPRHPSVNPAVTGGRDTVAVRMPSHPVAAGILEAFGGGLAAPSANRFGRVSPTSAADVVSELGREVDLVIDGGPCTIGVESTVVELNPCPEGPSEHGTVTILRPGGVSATALEEALGHPVLTTATGPARAPGMLASHYSPHTPLRLCDEREAPELVEDLASNGSRVGILTLSGVRECGARFVRDANGSIETFARSLYGWFREADSESLDLLVAVPPGPEGLGAAIRDRLQRAAHDR